MHDDGCGETYEHNDSDMHEATRGAARQAEDQGELIGPGMEAAALADDPQYAGWVAAGRPVLIRKRP